MSDNVELKTDEAKERMSSQVGERLKRFRQKLGLSQRELARRADLTNGALSNIEQGKVSPSVNSLEKILTALQLTLPEFFSNNEDWVPAVYRNEDFVHLHKNDTDYQILPFAGVSRGSYIAQLRYKPGARINSEWMVHGGFIAGIVIEGELELVLEGSEYHLQISEGFYFSHLRHHSFSNKGRRDCVVVAVSLGV